MFRALVTCIVFIGNNVICSRLQYGYSLSPEDALELDEVDNWLEMMADFESAESDHLIALAMR